MSVNIVSVTDLRWANPEKTAVDCKIKTVQFGDELLPFTASPTDTTLYAPAIFSDIVAGKYGFVAEYVAPPEPALTVA